MGDMTDHQVAICGSLRDVLRALERDEHGLLPPASESSQRSYLWPASRSVPSASEVERLPAPDETDDVPASRWRDRSAFWPGTVLAMAVPVVGMLFAGLLLLAPTPDADWARAALNDLWLDEAVASAPLLPAALAGDLQPTGLQAFAALGQRALGASALDQAQAPARRGPYGLSAKPAIEMRAGETVDLAFGIKDADRLPHGARLIIRGVPENAALSSAEPQADGSWAAPVGRAGEVRLTAYALPAEQSRELVAELRTEAGELLASTTTRLTALPEPPLAAGWATATTPSEAPQVATVRDTGHPIESAPGAQRPTPEWMQPWNRSALGAR